MAQWISALSAIAAFSAVDGEVLRARDVEDHRFASHQHVARRGQLLGGLERHDDRAVAVGVDEVARLDGHAGDGHGLVEALQVHPRVGGGDRAGEGLEAGRPLRDVADRAVGDDAEAAERLVHRAVDLAPEAAVADVRAVEILDDADRRPGAGGDVLVVRGLPVARPRVRRARRADRRRARVADDGRQIRERGDQRLDGVAVQAALRGDDLHGVADRRRVEGPQRLEHGIRERIGHGRLPIVGSGRSIPATVALWPAGEYLVGWFTSSLRICARR